MTVNPPMSGVASSSTLDAYRPRSTNCEKDHTYHVGAGTDQKPPPFYTLNYRSVPVSSEESAETMFALAAYPTTTYPDTAVAPYTRRFPASAPHFNRGDIIFSPSLFSGSAYTVESGEVIVIRNGQIVDLVESGELLWPDIWPGAVAVAYTDCRLAEDPHNIGFPAH